VSPETLRAPAKLTLSLRVTGVVADGPRRGYHLIDAVMTTLDLHDVIEIDELPAGSPSSVSYAGRFSDGLNEHAASRADLVSRALRVTGRSARVTVTKNIPHGGGLGGGSADAAAILHWAGVTDLEVAADIGADVAFCLAMQSLATQGLVSPGRARVRGIGEIVEPMTPDPGVVTLIVPPFSVSTPAVYRAFDELENLGAADHEQHLVNDLETAAMRIEPRLADWKSRIVELTGCAPTLAGSGSTWFVIGDHGYLSERLPEATVEVTRYQ
jgi:4-diphosphocytidyl-2-C-methyl-D-erythritol kinase